jgi:uncharacterized protein YggE
MYKIEKHRWLFVLLVVAALTLTGCVTSPAVDSTKGEMSNTVSVVGYGEAFGKPDIATVSFGYNTADEVVASALERANMTIEGITHELAQLGLNEVDVQTTNFSVWPEDQYDPETGMLTGVRLFRVENQIRVIVRDINLVPEVIQAALDQGASNVYGLTFGIDDTTVIAAEARTAAVADARTRAEQLAQELGAELGEAQVASEMMGGGVYPSAEYAMGIGGGGGPPMSEGQLGITVQVSVTFDLIR